VERSVHRDLLPVGLLSLCLFPMGVFLTNIIVLYRNRSLIDHIREEFTDCFT
jgi:hypothetical protein